MYAFAMESLEAMAMLNNPEKMTSQLAPYNKDLFTEDEVLEVSQHTSQHALKSVLTTN